MKKERKTATLARLQQNTGQIDWLPKNPRQWTQTDIDRTVKSIEEDTDFLEDRPLLAVENGDKLVVFAGNLRLTAVRKTDQKAVPVVVYSPESDEDQETIKRRALKDNGSFGSWDYDTLANEWDGPFEDWGVPAWSADMGLTTKDKDKDKDKEYTDFEKKFEPKLTTDDCYTPPEVYNIIVDFINEKIRKIDRGSIIRPFYPGGDYERELYPAGCVVIDNPPFSIYTKVVRFFCEKNIPFFLFAPALTAQVHGADVCYVLPAASVIYENGAVVSTAFVTNMVKDVRYWVETTLREKILTAQKRDPRELGNYDFPANVWTAARLQKIAKGDEDFFIKSTDCEYIRNLDAMKDAGKGLFGGGIIVDDETARAAERAAERAESKISLSESEREIVLRLNNKHTDAPMNE